MNRFNIFLLSAIAATFISCEGNDPSQDDENATIVNISKGVAAPVWSPEAEATLPETVGAILRQEAQAKTDTLNLPSEEQLEDPVELDPEEEEENI